MKAPDESGINKTFPEKATEWIASGGNRGANARDGRGLCIQPKGRKPSAFTCCSSLLDKDQPISKQYIFNFYAVTMLPTGEK